MVVLDSLKRTFDAIGASISRAWSSRLVRRSRKKLRRAAKWIPFKWLRTPLMAWLQPPALEEGMPGELRGSGANLRLSGLHPSPPSLDGSSQSGPTPARPMPRRKGSGTFTPAPAAKPKGNLGGAPKSLSGDEQAAVQKELERRKESTRALAMIQKHRDAFGQKKLEQLALLERTFAPEPLKAFRQKYPAVTPENLKLMAAMLTALSRDDCERAAVHANWSEEDRRHLIEALPAAERGRHERAAAALNALEGPARQELLRLGRAPVHADVELMVRTWKTLPPDDIRAVALAVSQFTLAELRKALTAAPLPVKIAPGGLRG